MSIFKLSIAILTWSLDELASPFINRRIGAKLQSKAPKDPYLFRRSYRKHHNKDIPTRTTRKPKTILLQHRKPVTVSDLNLEPGVWTQGEFYIEEHDASHLHHDFSIIVNDKVYRVARTPAITNMKKGLLGLFPGPGEKTAFVPQPEHLPKEVPNPKLITEGYGKGTTKVLRNGGCLVNISHGNNMHVIFEGIEGTYVFVEAGNGSTLMMRKLHKPISFGKHKMIDKRDVPVYINDPNYIFFTKKDGAGIEWVITESKTGHQHLQLFSWRPDAKLRKKYGVNTQIEHTQRIKLCDKEVNKSTPLSAGRAELWCKGENGLLHVNALLNSLPYKSRTLPYKPELYIHDVMIYEGKDVSKLPYTEKLTLMKNINKHDNRFKIPEHTSNPKAKQSLWNKLKTSDSVDGVIAWKIGKAEPGIKLKFKHDQDNWFQGTIVDIVPQEGQHHKKYGYPIIENMKGVQFKCSGVGLTEEVRAHMLKNPDDWIGTGVRYSAERHFDSGTPFQPNIKVLHSE